jgi:hypothetical protein
LAIGSILTNEQSADGEYDDVRVYNRALPANQIRDLFNGTTSVYIPPSDPSEDRNRNWTLERTFDGAGRVIGESKQFADGLGRPTQLQIKSLAKRHVLATQTIYNTAGIGVLSTLPAPTYNQEFKYKTDFITSGGAPYTLQILKVRQPLILIGWTRLL